MGAGHPPVWVLNQVQHDAYASLYVNHVILRTNHVILNWVQNLPSPRMGAGHPPVWVLNQVQSIMALRAAQGNENMGLLSYDRGR